MNEWGMVIVGTVIVAALAWLAYANWRKARHARAALESVWKAKAQAQRDVAASVKVSGAVMPGSYLKPAATQYTVTEKPKRKPRSDKGKRRTKLGPREKDITGQRFGLLVALGRVGVTKRGTPKWRFRCDCGNETVKAKHHVASPSSGTVSCGCWKREMCAELGRSLKGTTRKAAH